MKMVFKTKSVTRCLSYSQFTSNQVGTQHTPEQIAYIPCVFMKYSLFIINAYIFFYFIC